MAKFVVGVGAQFAGMSMLHALLVKADKTFMHPLKATHYYDSLSGVRDIKLLRSSSYKHLAQQVGKIVSAKDGAWLTDEVKCELRSAQMLAEDKLSEINYLDLYRPCVKKFTLLGEVCHEYLLLPDATIKKMSVDMGADANIIIMTRDPVVRFMNAYRLTKNKDIQTLEPAQQLSEIESCLQSDTDWAAVQDKTNDYPAAIARYRKHFKQVLVLSYEESLKKPFQFAKKVETFLGVPMDTSMLPELIAKETKAAELDKATDALVELLSKRYQKSIDFLNKQP